MKLGTKLVIFSIFTILIPMLIIGFYAVFLLYRNTELAQWEFLENVENKIKIEVTEMENEYLLLAKELAGYDYVRDKVYVYNKYWNQISENLINYDLTSLKDFIKEKALLNNIETIAIYRKDNSDFRYVFSVGSEEYLPDVLYKGNNLLDYSKIVYMRYYDGIYLSVAYPIFSDGRLVGLVFLLKALSTTYFSEYTSAYNIDIALISKGVVLYNSNMDVNMAIKELIANEEKDPRINFDSNTKSYVAAVFTYHLSESAVGELVFYSERTSLLAQDGFVVQKFLLLVLFCVMIPVVTFFIKEIRLIKAINSLVDATDTVSRGDYNSPVEIKSSDEIGVLSRNFNAMVAVLKRNKNALESQNMELAIKNSYIDAVFQSLQINIVIVDKQNKIQVVSKNTSSRLEMTEEQIGEKIFDVAPFCDKADVIEKTLNQIWEHRKFFRLYTLQFGNIDYEIDFYPVIEESNELSAVVIILNNITERMGMERALIRSDRLASVGQLAAGLAHEINNPMSIILNHVQLLKSGDLSKEEEKRFMERVETEIKRVSKLINSLLKFSREDISKLEHISPEEIIKEVVNLFAPKAVPYSVDGVDDSNKIVSERTIQYIILYKSKKIQILFTSARNNLKIFCSRDGFKQIIFNIIKNSLESCGDIDGIIRITFRADQGGIRINIADNGNGISELDLENVFEPFFSRQKAGTGLGLSLCKSMMSKYGGTIHIDSIDNKGTTVSLFFPFRENMYG